MIESKIHKEVCWGLKYFNPGGSHKTAFPVCLLYKSTQSVFFPKTTKGGRPFGAFHGHEINYDQ